MDANPNYEEAMVALKFDPDAESPPDKKARWVLWRLFFAVGFDASRSKYGRIAFCGLFFRAGLCFFLFLFEVEPPHLFEFLSEMSVTVLYCYHGTPAFLLLFETY